MKLLCFNDNQMGILKDDRVVDVTSALPHWGIKPLGQHVEEVIEEFDSYRPKFEEIASREAGVPVGEVNLLPPIPNPPKVLAGFANYKDRPERQNLPQEFFYKSPTGIIGPGGTVELPDIPAVEVYQAEAEIAYVIGKRGKNVSEAQAMDYVFGYMPFFDVSARGTFRRTQFIGKGQDTFCPIGPYLVTKDEVPDPHNLRVQSWLNGDPRQDYNTSYMMYYLPAQIAWLSKYVTLEPGDVIATGTHHDGLQPINGGDTLEIEIEKLGRLSVNIKAYGSRKDVEWVPGVNQAKQPEGAPWTPI